jgi:hypothetical protein
VLLSREGRAGQSVTEHRKSLQVCEAAVESTTLSSSEVVRMAMCFTGLAAKGALERLDQATLQECIKIFRTRAKSERHLSSLFSFCKMTLQARYGRVPSSGRVMARRETLGSSSRGRTPASDKHRLSRRGRTPPSSRASDQAAQRDKNRPGSRDSSRCSVHSAPHLGSAFAPMMCVPLGRYLFDLCPLPAVFFAPPQMMARNEAGKRVIILHTFGLLF